jgi:P27 family predicted phage terminase small subunit
MRGRKPKPTREHELNGNPSRKQLNKREPKPFVPSADFDEPPPELDGEIAQDEWRRLAPILRRARMVTEGDRTSLLALCQQWDIYLTALGKVRSLVVTTRLGVPIPNPYLNVSGKALTQCIRLWSELGCTPSARSRVVTTEKTGGDALEAALDGDATHDPDPYAIN